MWLFKSSNVFKCLNHQKNYLLRQGFPENLRDFQGTLFEILDLFAHLPSVKSMTKTKKGPKVLWSGQLPNEDKGQIDFKSPGCYNAKHCHTKPSAHGARAMFKGWIWVTRWPSQLIQWCREKLCSTTLHTNVPKIEAQHLQDSAGLFLLFFVRLNVIL